MIGTAQFKSKFCKSTQTQLKKKIVIFFLQVESLVKKCKEHVQSKAVTEKNAVELWKAAVLYDMDKLKAVVLNFMAANWKKMKHSPDLKQLPREYTRVVQNYTKC